MGVKKCNLTLQVLVQDVLEAVENRLVILDFSALGGVGPLLAALEVGVHLTRVGGVLFVMRHLHTHGGWGRGGKHNKEFGQCKQQKSRLDLHVTVNYLEQTMDSLHLIVTRLHNLGTYLTPK